MKLIQDQKGSVTIELAMFISVICGLIFGYMVVMNGIKTSIALQVAAREGSRAYAATDSATTGQAKANLELANMGVTGATPRATADGPNRSILIEKNYDYMIPLFGSYSTKLRGYCTFYLEPVFAEGG